MKIFWILSFTLCSARHQNEDKTEARLIGGDYAIELEHRSHVLIGVTYSGRQFHKYCMGTLISRLTVLTSAHCLEQTPPIKDLELILGGHNLYRNPLGHDTIRVDKKDFKIHQGYYRKSRKYAEDDIALIYLPTNVLIDERYVAVAQLFQSELHAGDRGTMIGYGNLMFWENKLLKQTGSRAISKKKYMKIMGEKLGDNNYLNWRRRVFNLYNPELAALDDNKFRSAVLDLYKARVDKKMVFFVYNGKSSIGDGDSGGPYIVNNQVSGIATGTCGDPQETGVEGGVASASWSKLPESEKAGITVFLRVRPYLDWIKENIK